MLILPKKLLLHLNNVIDILKNKGIKNVIIYIISRIVQKKIFYVFEININDILEVEQISDIKFRKLNKTELDINKITNFWIKFYQSFYPLYTKKEQIEKLITERLENGEICVIGENDNSIVYFHWICFNLNSFI